MPRASFKVAANSLLLGIFAGLSALAMCSRAAASPVEDEMKREAAIVRHQLPISMAEGMASIIDVRAVGRTLEFLVTMNIDIRNYNYNPKSVGDDFKPFMISDYCRDKYVKAYGIKWLINLRDKNGANLGVTDYSPSDCN